MKNPLNKVFANSDFLHWAYKIFHVQCLSKKTFSNRPVPSKISQNEWRQIFFWIFGVKNIKFTNFRHYSPILGDFRGFGTFFCDFLDFLNLEHFWKVQCSEIHCAFVWHPNTLNLSSIIKNISNFMKFIKKNSWNKTLKINEFLTVTDTFGPYNQVPTWILKPSLLCNFIDLRMIFFSKIPAYWMF